MRTKIKTVWYVLGTAIEKGLWWGGHPLEIEECEKCGGKMKAIASIEEPEVIEKILKHLGLDRAAGLHNRSPPACADGLFDQTTILI